MARGFCLDSRAGSSRWFSGSRISVLELRVLTTVDLYAECCVLSVCCVFFSYNVMPQNRGSG